MVSGWSGAASGAAVQGDFSHGQSAARRARLAAAASAAEQPEEPARRSARRPRGRLAKQGPQPAEQGSLTSPGFKTLTAAGRLRPPRLRLRGSAAEEP